ncbi:putative sorting nexin-15 [Scophthalmus maximus]|uniref:Putative sorting nexin-15 n=1 Tax=Scophthalmus maximus TaxID=52904 RepID=A0A2U9BAC1_SCOMX|nr:putative sorting nexin-15 [Scophthalmus maximus]
MSRQPKEEHYRFFAVTDPRAHEKGHTEYKVTARFVSKRHPEDVKEVVVWRRFSELKKLHGELAFTHRNLFRRQEEFPPFPRAQVFGRFEEAVIEERRKAAEAMLLFSTTIPALYNSPQLKDFFRGGEVTRPLDPTPLSTAGALPPPLIPLPKRRASDCEPAEEEEGREAPTLPQDLGTNLGLEVGEPEVAAEAYSEMGGSPREEEREELSDTELDDRVPSPNLSPARDHKSLDSQEEFDSLFDSAAEDQVPSPKEEDPPPLSDNDLAVFDPCYKQDRSSSTSDHSELFWLPPTSLNDGDVDYLNQAATELTAAMEREKEGEFSSAIHGYRTAVDILITGVQVRHSHEARPPGFPLIHHLHQPGGATRRTGAQPNTNPSTHRHLEDRDVGEVLQEKVWRAFGEKHMAEEEKKRGDGNRGHVGEGDVAMMEEEDITEAMYDEEDIDDGEMEKEAFSLLSVSPFDNFHTHKRREERQKDRERRMERGRGGGLPLEGILEGAGLWLDCGGLVRGDWDGGIEDEGEEGGQKFAQALKLELGSAVARVIDRVLRLYTETTDLTPSSPPAAISFLPSDEGNDGGRERGVWMGLLTRGRGEEKTRRKEEKMAGQDGEREKQLQKMRNGSSGPPGQPHRTEASDLTMPLAVQRQEGLSPCHLKKAKLMFFHARYPSSNTLKTYFPDVKFNRCVTSQMIKWFSNFREFFYIQMERFARQAVREALTRDGAARLGRESQLRVGRDTELYRILNMHYNKSNIYQVPERFIEVSEVALREFYSAIWTGRDSDPCWKKGIYKIICKLDSPVPDAFRLPGCPVG